VSAGKRETRAEMVESGGGALLGAGRMRKNNDQRHDDADQM
jgi:hypothetical protein